MDKRLRRRRSLRAGLGALFAAAGIVLAFVSVAVAAPPTYSISVNKSADPAAVPAGGGDVEYTITVTATGTGFFNTVNVDDGMAGCALSGPSGDAGSDGKLSSGETWTYTCTVTNVQPNTENTAVVNACHDVSACNQDAHDASGQWSVTVTGGGSEPPASEPPASEPPASEPAETVGPPASEPAESTPVEPTEESGGASEPATDTAGPVEATGHGPSTSVTLQLLAVLCFLVASVLLVSPATERRVR